MRTILSHSSGEYLEDTFAVRLQKNDPQSIGSAITYFRRYALMAVLGIAPEDDDGASVMPYPKPPVPVKPGQPMAPIDNPGEFVIAYGKKYVGKKIKEVPRHQLASYIEWVKNDPKETPSGRDLVKHGKAYLGLK